MCAGFSTLDLGVCFKYLTLVTAASASILAAVFYSPVDPDCISSFMRMYKYSKYRLSVI